MGYLDESWQSKTIRNTKGGNSLAVQWLGLCVFTAEGPGSIPGRGSKIPKAMQGSQKKKKFIQVNKNFICGIYKVMQMNVFIYKTETDSQT